MTKKSRISNKTTKDLDDSTPLSLHHELKARAYDSGIKKIRSNLSPGQRLFSQFAQSKAIDNIGLVLANTLARSGALLVGSIFAFFGTLVVVYEAKHYGYSYNYYLTVYIFIVGYLVGLIAELILKSITKSK
jgi:hypothetical protein